MSLATKYRPKTWEEVVGQDSIISILNKQIETDNIKNTYIFSGASGCGKTTVARLFINKINNNCGQPFELDAASNSGVDNIRDITRLAQERAIDSKYKAYIIDECHALSNQAWQAFLKCIEEPPSYTIFIFCTTEKNKVPDTIKNRCQVFNFNRISFIDLEERLRYICSLENCTNYNEACNYISKISNGQVRDSISNLEKCISYNRDLSISNVIDALGDYSYNKFFELINAILDGDSKKIYICIENIYNDGSDLKLFVDKFLDFCLDLSKYCLFKDLSMIKIPSVMESNIKSCTLFDNSISYYNYYTNNLLDLKNMLKNDINPLSTIEVVMEKMSRGV